MADDARMPLTPITELAAGAVQLHEWFLSLVSAGFTPHQALALMGEILRPRPPS